jgi:hypothetical protein
MPSTPKGRPSAASRIPARASQTALPGQPTSAAQIATSATASMGDRRTQPRSSAIRRTPAGPPAAMAHPTSAVRDTAASRSQVRSSTVAGPAAAARATNATEPSSAMP